MLLAEIFIAGGKLRLHSLGAAGVAPGEAGSGPSVPASRGVGAGVSIPPGIQDQPQNHQSPAPLWERKCGMLTLPRLRGFWGEIWTFLDKSGAKRMSRRAERLRNSPATGLRLLSKKAGAQPNSFHQKHFPGDGKFTPCGPSSAPSIQSEAGGKKRSLLPKPRRPALLLSHTRLGEGSHSLIAGSLSSSRPDFNTVHQAKHAG